MNMVSIPRTAVSPFRSTAQAGAVTVEMAFVIVVLMLMVAGIFAFGRTFWYADALTKSVRDGARLLSTWPIDTINSAGVSAARQITLNSANAANVSPPLVSGNVVVQCLDSTFSAVPCANGTAPANVRVSITGFNVILGEWFPFVGTSGHGTIGVSPHTTMRYMN